METSSTKKAVGVVTPVIPSSDLSFVLKTQVTDGELDGAAVISDGILSRVSPSWRHLSGPERSAA